MVTRSAVSVSRAGELSYQSNMRVDTLGHLLATCVWIPFDIPESNMHVDTLGHLKATCMWIPLDISKATRIFLG